MARAFLGANPGVTKRQLIRGNRWLIQLRWVASVGIVVATLLASGPLGYPVPARALLGLGVLVAAYNLVLRLADDHLARGEGVSYRAAQVLANLQIALDLIALAWLIHLAGGIENPFAIYLLFHMIIAGVLLPPLAAFAQAALASALYAAVIFGECRGLLPSHPVFSGQGPALSLLDLGGVVAVMTSALFIAAYLTSVIAQQLRQREQELALALEESRKQTNACEIARAGLQQTQEMRLAYMRRVSHELRAPLSTVSMTLRVLLDQAGATLPESLYEMVRRADSRVETTLDLVGDLLTLSRIREAPLEEPRAPVDFVALVEGVQENLGDAAVAHEVTIAIEVAPALPAVQGQPEALHTMLLNLVGNAIKYTPAGGQVTVRVRPAETGEAVTLQVADTGMGIAAEELPRLFEEFFRTEAARQSGIHGTGLGLSIVRLTAQAHGGEVRVESELGKGSIFTVRLPASASPSAAAEAPPAPV